MRKPGENDLASRRRASAEAKAASLRAHSAAKEAAEPTRLERQQEQLGIAVASSLRRAERDQAKLEDHERVQAEARDEQSASEAAAKAEGEATEKALNDRVSRVIEDEAG
jgi:hypothetical protein